MYDVTVLVPTQEPATVATASDNSAFLALGKRLSLIYILLKLVVDIFMISPAPGAWAMPRRKRRNCMMKSGLFMIRW